MEQKEMYQKLIDKAFEGIANVLVLVEQIRQDLGLEMGKNDE